MPQPLSARVSRPILVGVLSALLVLLSSLAIIRDTRVASADGATIACAVPGEEEYVAINYTTIRRFPDGATVAAGTSIPMDVGDVVAFDNAATLPDGTVVQVRAELLSRSSNHSVAALVDTEFSGMNEARFNITGAGNNKNFTLRWSYHDQVTGEPLPVNAVTVMSDIDGPYEREVVTVPTANLVAFGKVPTATPMLVPIGDRLEIRGSVQHDSPQNPAESRIQLDFANLASVDIEYSTVFTAAYFFHHGHIGIEGAECTPITALIPEAVDDVRPRNGDGSPVIVDVLTNDNPASAGGAELVAESVVLLDPADSTFKNTVVIAGEGTWVANLDGTVTFTPEADFTNTTTPITYRVSDDSGVNAQATVTVLGLPTATDDSTGTLPGTPVTIEVLDNDTDNGVTPLDPTTVVLVDPDSSDPKSSTTGNGTWRVNTGGTVTFTPDGGFTGTTTIDYEVSDEDGLTVSATITVTVAAPAAHDDDAGTRRNTPVTIDVLDNDEEGLSPFDPDTLVLVDPADAATKPIVDTGDGIWRVNTDGTVTFMPAGGFTGTTTIDYKVTDEDGETVSATITVHVDSPVAIDDTATTGRNTPVTIDVLDNDIEGHFPLDPDTLVLVDPADAATKPIVDTDDGTWEVNDDGTVTFTPAPAFTGTTTIDYEVTDEDGETVRATITVTVTAPAPPGPPAPAPGPGTTTTALPNTTTPPSTTTPTTTPGPTPQPDDVTAIPDAGRTNPGEPVTINPIDNDESPSGQPLDPSSVRVVDPSTGEPLTRVTTPQGTWQVNPGGSVTFTPAPGFTGTATIDYVATDVGGLQVTSTIRVEVQGAVLPRTGIETGQATLIAMASLLLGFILVTGSRRSIRRNP